MAIKENFYYIHDGKRVKLTEEDLAMIPRINSVFKKQMVKDYDLILGLHAHGSNIQIIDACYEYNKNFLLLPCCVIDEPVTKKPNIDWKESLIEYSAKMGFKVKRTKLNFKGQNELIYSEGRV